jgi:guanylate kinase/C-terminal processing protease CtpA/Prc
MLDKMPVRKQEAYRALELLEEYYNRLDAPEDKPLKNAIDRVIKVFKSRLFQALLDIQEFYESILLDEQNDRNAKVNATHHLADEWERQPMLRQDVRNGKSTTMESSTVMEPLVTENPVLRPPNITKENSKREPTLTPFAGVTNVPSDSTNRQTTSGLTSQTGITQFHYDDHWQEIEIDLHRSSTEGLGFSIAGGTDTPCINNSSAVVITRITEGGLAARDRRLKLHDIILRVNEKDFTQIEHQPAVDWLKAAGNHVILLVRRLAPPFSEEIELEKPANVHLGFSIAGGITNEHVKGDHGIFITNIIPGGVADKQGHLRIGDRLIQVQSMKNSYDLEFVEHKHAVESIRHACDEGPKITLTVAHPSDPPSHGQTQQRNIPTPNQPVITNQPNGQRALSHDELRELPVERRVLLRRGTNGFGFHIIGDENEQGIFISSIQSGGAADKSGELRKGDQILSVNNIELRGASHADAVSVLKSCGDTAILHVINKSNDSTRLDNRNDERTNRMTKDSVGSTGSLKTTTKRQFFVRAEFDYDPARDPSLPSGPGLAFRTGDILNIINSADDSWWQAKRVTNGQDDEEFGIIPSKSRVEKKERARQKRVNFNPGSHSRSNTLDRDKKKKKKFGLFNKSGDKKDTQSGEDSEIEPENLEPVPSYELVTDHRIDYARPIIIFGPFKEILNDQLLNERPDQFANCVPHTSRPKRDKEVDGREYYFVPTREQMEKDIQNYLFIEAGEYGGNLYGTSVIAVREVANTSKHCILDVSGHAIRRLISAGLYPIVIYVKAPDLKWIMDNMGEDVNEERAQQMLEKATKIEQQFGNLFTITIQEDTLSEVYDRICDIIEQEEKVDHAWIPSKEKI